MSNKLIAVGLMLVLMWPLMAGDKKSVDHYNGPTKDMTTLRSIDGIGDNMYVIGSDANYDAVLTENDAMPAFMAYGFGRGTADTLAYVPADGGWNGQFIQSPGDAMLVMFKMPADGIVKGVNVPVYEWGTGEQQMTISVHKVSYPSTSDGATYPSSAVDGAGWTGGYDMDAAGHMSIEGTTYAVGGTVGICDPGDAVVAGAQDPLGDGTAGTGPSGVPTNGLIWPDGFTSAVLTPDANPAQADNWLATADYGTEPELMQNDWVGVLFASTGAGGGDDAATGFYYEAGDGVVDPWIFSKFYVGCGGTSGNGGWHIRHWMVNAQLAVELTGDRGPVFASMTSLPTTISNDVRAFEANVTDDNPSGEAAGVSAVTVTYQLDSLTAEVTSVALTMTAGTAEDGTWSGEFPGQAAGTMVYYQVTAYDNNGLSTATAMASYYVFAPTAGAPLLFDNGNALYGVALYAPYCYYGWGLNPFDYWSRDYGNITSDLVANYSSIWERGDEGPDFNTDGVINPWYDSGDKTYVAGGDEWLGVRYGWSGDTEMAEGSLAYRLGVGTYLPDINGAASAISKMVPNADDPLGAGMDDYLDSNVVTMVIDSSGTPWDTSYTYAPSTLVYDPNYDPGHSNWLDGITAHAGGNTPYSAYYGGIDSVGNVGEDAAMVPVAVYAQAGNGSKGGLIAFDQMSLYARVWNDTGSVTYDHWVGPEDYYSDLPGGLTKGMLDWSAGVVSIDNEVVNTPDKFSLKGNYPNPFNPSTNIMFTLGMASDVTVKVYSILGEEIATLHNGSMIPGTHSLRWNGLTNNGFNVASGVYFYQVDVAGQVKTGKMMLMK